VVVSYSLLLHHWRSSRVEQLVLLQILGVNFLQQARLEEGAAVGPVGLRFLEAKTVVEVDLIRSTGDLVERVKFLGLI